MVSDSIYSQIALVSSLVLIKVCSSSTTYYCENGKTQTITGETEGSIKSRETEGGISHNNLRCSWVIVADEGRRISLTVQKLDLQWSPQYTTCSGYDNMKIVEGNSRVGMYRASICHAKNPQVVISKGSTMFLEMSTTQQDFAQHKGIELKFETFHKMSCPPGWFQASGSETTCLRIGSQGKVDWESSQEVCAFSLANLVSITSEQEAQAILEHGRNRSIDLAWIGLNNIGQDSFRWVDQRPYQYKRTITGYGYRTNCIAQEFSTGNWKALGCDKHKLYYICKAKKDGSTVIYPAIPPAEPPQEESEGTKLYLVVIIVVVLVVFAAVGLLVFCYCRRNKKCCWSESRSRSRSQPRSDSQTRELDSMVPSGSGYQPAVAPPTYKEALDHY